MTPPLERGQTAGNAGATADPAPAPGASAAVDQIHQALRAHPDLAPTYEALVAAEGALRHLTSPSAPSPVPVSPTASAATPASPSPPTAGPSGSPSFGRSLQDAMASVAWQRRSLVSKAQRVLSPSLRPHIIAAVNTRHAA